LLLQELVIFFLRIIISVDVDAIVGSYHRQLTHLELQLIQGLLLDRLALLRLQLFALELAQLVVEV
jgi:hypothetical protein